MTVQLRFDGWVTEMQDAAARQQLDHAAGIDNLLYSADADFSCFADLALTSPKDYYREGQGSLMQVVLTPGDPFIKMSNEEIAQHALQQLHDLFPSSRDLTMTWFNVVKLAQSLYRENPGMDVYRPPQKTPVPNFFLAGSYTQQDYIDSMEGATISGMQAAAAILEPTGYKVKGAGLFKY
ncbi:FAD-dependent oxidoreductase [Leptolyngbya sp. 7M]|uniref:FAD-dependent oxidoreductase n=1 Tax=Leptolyngbya sp. 7M TaxID=2812896 RepID=UPI002938DEA7|nr:FAD-dependent oxidoreductase [Leptolyngbya sp. 7M]